MNPGWEKKARKLTERLGSIAALAVVAMVIAPTGSAKPPSSDIKLYDACLSGGSTPCTAWDTSGGSMSTLSGATPTVTLNIHNERGSNTTLGSVNLDLPAGLTLDLPVADSNAATSTSTQLQLRNLNLASDHSYSVTFTVTATDTCGTVDWTIAGKQSNEFNGSGNDFLLKQWGGLTSLVTGGCHLAWIYQPASARQGDTVTDTAFTPTVGGDVHNVAVEVQDASGNPVALDTGTATLTVGGAFDDCGAACDPHFTGLTSTTFQDGRATFPDLQSAYTGTGFTAQASAVGLTSAASSPSFVIENGIDCAGLDPCHLDTQIGNSNVSINANGGNFLFLAVSSTQLPPSVIKAGGGCENFIGTGTTFAETDSRNGDGTVDITLSIPNSALKQAYGPNYGQPNVPICAGAKVVDPVSHEPVDCNPDTQQGWADRKLAADGTFQGEYGTAVCGAGGYWWGILGTYQDPKPAYDSTQIPLITGWGGSGGSPRTFTIHEPAGWDGQFGC